jgi:hypothetical protein
MTMSERTLAWIARAAAVVTCAGVAAASSGCGYALAGRGSFLPGYVQTIGIPLFVNNTSAFDAEQILTSRVRQEFIARGKYKVTPETTGADAVLDGRLVSITLVPAGFNDQRQATRYTVQIVMSITLRDIKAGRVLWENPALVYREEFDVVSAASDSGAALDVSAFFGQGGNALERMAAEFARSTVTTILEAF